MPTELFANNPSTPLNGVITNVATTLVVTSAALFPVAVAGVSQFRVIIESEILIVTNTAGLTWTVTRGAEGTVAAGHATSIAVTHILTSGSLGTFASAATTIPAALRLSTGYGQADVTGTPNKPYVVSTTAGGNLWALANFTTGIGGPDAPAGGVANTTTLTPSMTADGTAKASVTRVVLSPKGNNISRFRFTGTVTTTAVTDSAFTSPRVQIVPRTNTGATAPYWDRLRTKQTGRTTLAAPGGGTPLNGHRFVVEMDCGADMGSSVTGFDVIIVFPNSTTAGSISLTNVSLYRIHSITPTINLSWDRTPASGAHIFADVALGLDGAGNAKFSRFDFGPDSALPIAPLGTAVNYDAAFGGADRGVVGSVLGSNYPSTQLFQSNSDTILGVYLADGATTELRGNTHGGETGQTGTFGTDFTLFGDFGDGAWTPITTFDNYWWPCLRMQIRANTKFNRSDQAATPFLFATKTYTLYPDGTMRYDRTLTFQQAQKLDHWFWHMMSVPPIAGGNAYTGKVGRGAQTLARTEFTTKVPAPAATSPTTATTGGVITTGTYSVRVTALTRNGETGPSLANYAVTVPATTSTNTVTASWAAVTGATGYAVYLGMLGFEKRVATTVAGTLTYTITGSESPGQATPIKSTAVTTTGSDIVSSAEADWAAYLDPVTNTVVSMALDRAAVKAMPAVKDIRADLQRIEGALQKNYWHLIFTDPDLPYTPAVNDVYAGTVWYFVYQPTNVEDFEREQTYRGSSTSQLVNVYPSGA